jgi:hypothetical protein
MWLWGGANPGKRRKPIVTHRLSVNALLFLRAFRQCLNGEMRHAELRPAPENGGRVFC